MYYIVSALNFWGVELWNETEIKYQTQEQSTQSYSETNAGSKVQTPHPLPVCDLTFFFCPKPMPRPRLRPLVS